MRSDDSKHSAFSLYTQDEAEHAEDTARHSWLQWLEGGLDRRSGKKEDQVLAAVERMFRDGGEVREKVEMLFAKVEKLELMSQLASRGAHKHSPGPAHADLNAATSDLPPPRTIHGPAPELAALTAQLAQPAFAPAAQHAAPGTLQPAGAPSTGHSHLKKVVTVINAVRPLPPLPRPGLPRPLPPTL